jgi:hypothetical protein
VDRELSEAMDELIQLIETMPGAFRGEFQLGYWGGVAEGADAWSVRFEADIVDTEVFLTGSTPSAALRDALKEAKRRIPPTSQPPSDSSD